MDQEAVHSKIHNDSSGSKLDGMNARKILRPVAKVVETMTSHGPVRVRRKGNESRDVSAKAKDSIITWERMAGLNIGLELVTALREIWALTAECNGESLLGRIAYFSRVGLMQKYPRPWSVEERTICEKPMTAKTDALDSVLRSDLHEMDSHAVRPGQERAKWRKCLSSG